MTLTPTKYGYRMVPTPRAKHRAVMTAETARLNFEAKAGLHPWQERGAHWAPCTGAAAWLAEEDAQEREIIRAAVTR